MTAQRHAVDTNATDMIGQHAPIAPVVSDRLWAIRETVDLLEIDLGTMIRAVEQAAEKVRLGARASAESLNTIRGRTETLVAQSQDAKFNAVQFAHSSEELAQSFNEVGRRVREADALIKPAARYCAKP